VKAEVLMFSDLHIRGSKHRQVLIDSFNWVCEQIVEHLVPGLPVHRAFPASEVAPLADRAGLFFPRTLASEAPGRPVRGPVMATSAGLGGRHRALTSLPSNISSTTCGHSPPSTPTSPVPVIASR